MMYVDIIGGEPISLRHLMMEDKTILNVRKGPEAENLFQLYDPMVAMFF